MHVKRGKRKEDHAKALCWSNTCLDSSKGPEFVARIPESISLRWMTKMIWTLCLDIGGLKLRLGDAQAPPHAELILC